jgi:hypothetical protein
MLLSLPPNILREILNFVDYPSMTKLQPLRINHLVRRLHASRQIIISVQEFLSYPALDECSLTVQINTIQEFKLITHFRKIVPKMYICFHLFGNWDINILLKFLSLFQKRYGECLSADINKTLKTSLPRLLYFNLEKDSPFFMSWMNQPVMMKSYQICLQLKK